MEAKTIKHNMHKKLVIHLTIYSQEEQQSSCLKIMPIEHGGFCVAEEGSTKALYYFSFKIYHRACWQHVLRDWAAAAA